MTSQKDGKRKAARRAIECTTQRRIQKAFCLLNMGSHRIKMQYLYVLILKN